MSQAEKVFATVVNSSETHRILHTSMIDAYSKGGKHEEAYLFYKKETEQGSNFGPVAISMLVNALVNGGKNVETQTDVMCFHQLFALKSLRNLEPSILLDIPLLLICWLQLLCRSRSKAKDTFAVLKIFHFFFKLPARFLNFLVNYYFCRNYLNYHIDVSVFKFHKKRFYFLTVLK